MLTRRNAMVLGAGVAATALLPSVASAASVDEAIAAFTEGADVVDGEGVTLTTPEIAENGNTVPVSVNAPGAVSVMLLAGGNPSADVGIFNFGPLAANQSASTRIRLAGTQDVIAVAKMADGSFVRSSNTVKVTIGGCGG